MLHRSDAIFHYPMDLVTLLNYSFQGLITVASDTAIYWGPLIFGFFFWKIWLYFVRADYISKVKWTMLEIHIPREVYKPPQAMEMVLAALDQASKGSKIEQYWTGRVPLWFSLEIASIEGSLHFFIRTPSKFRDLVESRVYSQYPDAEIREAADYTELITFSKKGKIGMYGTEFILSKPDPYPIKTYVDYGLDRGFVDEKQRIDPMTPLLEFLGSVGKGEHVWLQILVMAAQKRYVNDEGKIDDWKAEAKAEIKKMVEGEKKEEKDAEKAPPLFRLTKTQNENIADIERNMTKIGFDCGIRIIYLAEEGKFNPGQIASIYASLKQFNSSELNGFKPNRDTALDYPFEDIDKKMGNIRLGTKKKLMFDAYRMRSYFYPPYKIKPFVLTTEELATIFRFPSAIAETPTLGRIESKKTEPPGNLPI